MRMTTLILLFCCASLLFGQEKSGLVLGVVTGKDGVPLPNITVRIKSTGTGTITDEAGQYSLRAAEGEYAIIFSGVGFESQIKTVRFLAGHKVVVDVALSENVSELQKVVVSASRKIESVDEVPSAITVVGQKAIEEQMKVNADISSVLQYAVPGLGFNTGRSSNTGQTLRGRQVLVLLDGIPQSTPLRNGGRDMRLVDPAAIERIEVIKGATAMYGNGADGGIINYITKSNYKRQSFSAYTQFGVSSGFDSETHGYRFNQAVSGYTGKTDYLANFSFERTGLIKSADKVPVSPFYNIGKMDNYNLLAKAGLQLNEQQRAEVMYNFYKSASHLDYAEKTGTWGVTPTIGVKSNNSTPGTPQGTPYNHNATLRFIDKNIFAGNELEASVYVQSFRTVYGYDPQFFLNGGQSNIKSEKSGIRLNLSTEFTPIAGVQAEVYYGVDILRDATVQALQDGRHWTPEMKMTNLAPFAQLKVDIIEDIVVKTGFRYENIGVNVEDFVTLKTYNTKTKDYTDGGVAVTGGKLSYNAFVGNAGIKYNRFAYFQPFFSFSQAFSINELGRILRASQKSIVSQLETKPIIVHNLEGGFSGRLDNLLDYELNYYTSTSKLGASYKENATGTFEIQRAPELVWGYEAVLNIFPLEYLSCGASYAFVEGKTDAENNGSYETYLGGDRIAVPKTTVYVQVNPVQPLSVTFSALFAGSRNRFSPNASGAYAYGQGKVQSYEIVNLAASYQITSQLQASLGVENLLNKDYYPAIAWWGARSSDFIKAAGRRAALSVGYNW